MNFKIFEKVLKNFATYKLQTVMLICATFACAEVVELNGMPDPQMRLNYSEGALGDNSYITATITIPEKWHVNANVAADEFLKPSSIKIEANGIEFGEPIWPVPKEQYSEALDFVNKIFEGTFQIKLPAKPVTSTYDTLSTKATFYYQACSNICLAPDSVMVTLDPFFKGQKEAEVQGPANDAPAAESSKAEVFAIEGLENIKDQDSKPAEEQVLQNAPEQKSSESIAFMLLLAFLGGVILNLMPCVLPVLSLKLFSLIRQAGESKPRLMALGFSTVLGILVSFWVLAGIVIVLRLGGANPGWGMQFQSSGFLLAMIAILTLFALSFFGIFEVWLPGQALTQMDGATRKEGLPGAFFTGALLVLLSTPCSAPMLGSAMGFAFNETAPILILFFTAAGLGLASPYIIVSLFPKLLKFLPKPGNWMVTLQKIMGVLLLASVAWLLWVAYRSYASSGLVFFGGIFILNTVGAFAIGKFAPPGISFKKELIAFTAIILLNILAKVSFGSTLQTATHIEDGYIAYSEQAMKDIQEKGSMVFLDVTADWCITCKANEAAVLANSELDEFFKNSNVQKVKADWTHGDEEVTKLLKSLGKSGVPAYAVYSNDKNKAPIVLSEILTTASIKEAVERAK